MKKFLVLVMALCMVFALGLAHAETEAEHGTTVQEHAEGCSKTAKLYECEDPACYVAADCGEETDGKQAMHCEECGRIVKVVTLKWEHSWETIEEEEAWDCTKDWTEPYKQCEDCGAYPLDEDGEEILPVVREAKVAHTIVPVIGALEDKCGVHDSFPAMCDVCKMELEGSIEMTIDHGEEYEEEVPAEPAGCMWNPYPGHTAGIRCTKCGEIKSGCEEVPPADDHNWVYVAGTPGEYCWEPELKARYQCVSCGAVTFNPEVKDENGEYIYLWDSSDFTVPGTDCILVDLPAQDADCESEWGWKAGKVCTQCGFKYVEWIEPGHVWARDNGKAATCEEPGVNAHNFCTRCGETDGKDTVIPAHGHSYENGYYPNTGWYDVRTDKWVKVIVEGWYWNEDDTETYFWFRGLDDIPEFPAECEKDGYKPTLSCEWCDAVYAERETLPATGHNMKTVEGDEGWAPTCERWGRSARQECINEGCDHETGCEPIAPLGHIMTFVPAKAPTCEEAGNYAYYKCSRESCETWTDEEGYLHLIHYFELAEYDPQDDAAFNDIGSRLLVPTAEVVELYSEAWLSMRAVDHDDFEVWCYQIPALDHGRYFLGYDKDVLIEEGVWAPIAGVPATCTTNGREDNGAYCTLCDTVVEKPIVINALGHSMVPYAYAMAPDCVNAGVLAFNYCEREGCTHAVTYATAGSIVDDGIATGDLVTIDINVVKTKDNTVDAKKLPSEVVLPARGHDSVPGAYKAPTCDEPGHTAGAVCSRCNVTLEKQEPIAKTGHDMQEVKPGKAPTCTEPGYKPYKVCQNEGCGKTEGGETENWWDESYLEPLGHDYANATVIPGYAATCNKPGLSDATKCGREGCDHLLVDHKEIPATGEHNWMFVNEDGEKENYTTTDEEREEIEYFCLTTIYENYNVCLDCGTEDPDGFKWGGEGHDIIEYNEDKPTCTEMGLTADAYCKNGCGYHQVSKVVPALGHDWVDYYGEDEDDKAATCTEDGWTKGVKCSRCPEIKTVSEPKAALGHDLTVHIDAVPATCTTDGNKTGLGCSRCDHKVGAETIKATGHKGVWSVEIEPTYDEYGLEVEICTECDTKLDAKLIDKLVSGALKGDVNKDGRVSLMDVLELLKVLGGESTNYSKENADVNGDGVPTLKDVFALLAMLS